MSKPNILFITTDQQRWDALGANGNNLIKTPNLDRLANEGCNFSNSYCAAAACQPSRASILTGVLPDKHGITCTGGNQNWEWNSMKTLPDLLNEQGYDTIGVGKMHFSPSKNFCGFSERIYIESKYNSDDEYTTYLEEQNMALKYIGHHTSNFGKFNKAIPSSFSEEHHIDSYIGNRCIEKLKSRSESENPYFMWLSFCGPHDPYDPPEPYASMYNPEDMPKPIRAVNELDSLPPIVRERTTNFGKEKITVHGISDEEHQRIRSLYYGNVSLIDHSIGKIIAYLEDQGELENTVIIFTSDHADCLGDHDVMWKTMVPSDADMKVPLLVRYPKLFKPCTDDDFVTGVDILPTILDTIGAKTPEYCDGKSLLNKKVKSEYALMFIEGNKWRYRDKEASFTWWMDQPFNTMYDLTKDAHELSNLCINKNQEVTTKEKNYIKLIQEDRNFSDLVTNE